MYFVRYEYCCFLAEERVSFVLLFIMAKNKTTMKANTSLTDLMSFIPLVDDSHTIPVVYAVGRWHQSECIAVRSMCVRHQRGFASPPHHEDER